MTTACRVLVVEDERDLAELLVYNLKKQGYEAVSVRDGNAAVAAIRQNPPDLVLLDVMLPGLSGLEVVRALRTNPRTATLPVIMLTARADETDQLQGLSVGADDYVTKPFSMKVLLARVASILRRNADRLPSESRIQVGPITADLAGHMVLVEDQDTKLTLTEFKLLTALMQAPARVLSRSELINRVMGPGIVVTARTIDVHIAALRKKLGIAGGMIRTIRGVGYQLMETNDGRRVAEADDAEVAEGADVGEP